MATHKFEWRVIFLSLIVYRFTIVRLIHSLINLKTRSWPCYYYACVQSIALLHNYISLLNLPCFLREIDRITYLRPSIFPLQGLLVGVRRQVLSCSNTVISGRCCGWLVFGCWICWFGDLRGSLWLAKWLVNGLKNGAWMVGEWFANGWWLVVVVWWLLADVAGSTMLFLLFWISLVIWLRASEVYPSIRCFWIGWRDLDC